MSAQVSPSVIAPAGKAIMQLVRMAVRKHQMFAPGDRVAVGISGGKDSLLLMVALKELQRELDIQLQAVHLDQHQPGFDRGTFDATLTALQVPCEVVSEDTWSVVSSSLRPGQIPCALCSRMRRGVLNRWCAERGYHKLALGHHLDDAVETFFLNLLYGRKLEPLKPVTPSEVGVHTVRPLLWVPEDKIVAWLHRSQVNAVPCPVCDSFPQSKRRDLKQMITQLRELHPGLHDSVRGALYSA